MLLDAGWLGVYDWGDIGTLLCLFLLGIVVLSLQKEVKKLKKSIDSLNKKGKDS